MTKHILWEHKNDVTYHSSDELVMYGFFYKQSARSDAVLSLIEVNRTHALQHIQKTVG